MDFAAPFRTIWSTLKVWWDGWFSMLLFGLAWLAACLTIILAPPATFGFFHAVRWWMVEKETKWDQFYQMAKKHFIASWLWFLANLFVAFVAFANYVFYGSLDNDIRPVMQTVTLVVAILWTAIQLYALPYYVIMEQKSLVVAWKNGILTILASPVFSAVIFAAIGLVAYVHVGIMPLLFGGPGLIVLLASMAVEDRVEKFGIRKRETPEENTPPDSHGEESA